MNAAQEKDFLEAYASTALALLSVMHNDPEVPEKYKAHIVEAVDMAPFRVAFGAAAVKHVFQGL